MKRGILLFGILALFLINFASAVQEGHCVEAEIKNIDPSSVDIGEAFTVGIIIDNCGDKLSENVKFEIYNVSPYLSVEESLMTEIGTMSYSNSKKFIIYNMVTTRDAEPGDYVIDYKLTYTGGSLLYEDTGNFTVDIRGDRAELNIASIKYDPKFPVEGDSVEYTLRVENYGDDTANNVNVFAGHSFDGTKESYMGSLDPNEDRPAVLTFVPREPGEFDFPVRISYDDDFGSHEIRKTVNMTILRKNINWLAIIEVIIALSIFAGIVYYLWNKNKEKVIGQLLTESKKSNGSNHYVKSRGKSKLKKIKRK